MKEIHISVREGVAVQTDHTPYITGDGEYRVVFDLEKEWEAHPLRTARFQTEGSYVDVVFRGNQCRVPVFTYARTLEVGIFAGNLRTTTPARIFLREGIRSAWGSPEAPAPNIYDQLMEALEDNGIAMEQKADGVRLTLRQRGGEQTAFLRYSEVYVGSGEMPEGYFVQVDPSGGTAVLRLRDRTGKITPIPSIRGEKGEKGDPGEPGPVGPKGDGERLGCCAWPLNAPKDGNAKIILPGGFPAAGFSIQITIPHYRSTSIWIGTAVSGFSSRQVKRIFPSPARAKLT